MDTQTQPFVQAANPPAPSSAAITVGGSGIAPKSMAELFIFAKAVINSGLAPRDFKSPEAVLVAVQFGMEIGLPPMAALQSVAVINGRPTLWGDALLGVCEGSGLVADYADAYVGQGDNFGARVTVKRRNRSEPTVRTFTIADAKKAGLWGKSGPWSQYPQRMLLMRARSWALRDTFPDVLRGALAREEADDIREPVNVTPAKPEQTLAALVAPAPTVPEVETEFRGDAQTLADIEASKEASS